MESLTSILYTSCSHKVLLEDNQINVINHHVRHTEGQHVGGGPGRDQDVLQGLCAEGGGDVHPSHCVLHVGSLVSCIFSYGSLS